MIAAVPVKDLLSAKQRLVGVLSPAERAALARAMLRDVLRALGAAELDGVWVVTRDAEAAAIAAGAGADVLAETENRGHTAAVALAQTEAARRGAAGFITVPGDAPCVTPDEIRALAAAVDGAPAAAFAPSRSGHGTNGVALLPPDLMPLTFGEPSFDNHLAAARRRGLAPRVVRLAGLGLDIDGPEDLQALLAEPAATESRLLVEGWSIAARLAARVAAHG